MKSNSLYNEDLWERFINKHAQSEKLYVQKTYPQFDPQFNFFKYNHKVKALVSDGILKSVSQHLFIPFVKILTKTPRYRYQENEKDYGLETKIRPIAFASHFDSYIYGFYSFALTEVYQEYIHRQGFQECVLAYRTDLTGKCNIQFAHEAFTSVTDVLKSADTCSAIALDITGYFDNIDHSILKEKWCKVIGKDELPIDQYAVFRTLTKYTYVNKASILRHFNIDLDKLKRNGEKWNSLLDLIPNSIAGKTFKEKFDLLKKRKLVNINLPKKEADGTLSFRGIPQGSPMSAVLSNIYLIDFDEHMYNLSIKYKFTYRRYCDDILIVCKTKDVSRINKTVLAEIKKYKLIIQPKKTEIIEFKKDTKNKLRSFNKKKIDENGITLTADNELKFQKNLQYLGFEFNGINAYIRPGSLSRYFKKMKDRISKTIMMAYSKNSKSEKVNKKQILERYSHHGKRNFITYALEASQDTYTKSSGISRQGLNSKSIKRQLSAHISHIKREINDASTYRFSLKQEANRKRAAKGKKVKPVILKR